jgi:DNA-binding sugar fermentation-stimulating protein
VKSVTLKEQGTGTALFPDAPTLRGSCHLEELILAIVVDTVGIRDVPLKSKKSSPSE